MNQNEETTLIYKWSPWIGCKKKSQGCKNCSSAQSFQGDSYYLSLNLDLKNIDLPLQRNSKGSFVIPQNSYVALEFNSDFFLEDMDFIRPYIWNIIKVRSDCHFITSTKRPERIKQCLPKDWFQGWDNVIIGCTIETQKLVEERLPIYLDIPLKKYEILTQPLIEPLDLLKYLPKINAVIAEGEFIIDQSLAELARPCNYKWVKSLSEQCKQTKTDFIFTLSGTRWINEKGKEQFISPFGWGMRDRIQEYNFDTGKLYDLNNNNFQFAYLEKE